MTREEAILHMTLRREELKHSVGDLDEDIKAFDMAIEALEHEPKFIAKADGTIEQIKDCEDCLFKKEWEKIGKLISVVLEKRTEPKTGWIPVSERLPELLERYTDAESYRENAKGQYEPVGIFTCFESDVVLVDAFYEGERGIFTSAYNEWRFADGRETETEWVDNTGGDLEFNRVIAWMPLPEPYKEG